MRYFLDLAYHGGAYNGWQKQPDAPSVQAALEAALGTLLRQATEVVGCGRTDTGVHASAYVAHFDGPDALPPHFLRGLNGLLPYDIAAQGLRPVPDTAHARFDASERAYVYKVVARKDPFTRGLAWQYPLAARWDLDKLNAAAQVLLDFEEFRPFCKAHGGNHSYRCALRQARWERTAEGFAFHIAADRFLRGMVRLIVGTCVQCAEGKWEPEALRAVMAEQAPLPKAQSAPAEGLYLCRIDYPDF